MKLFYFFCIGVFSLSACSSPFELYEKQNYNAAFEKSYRAVHKSPLKAKLYKEVMLSSLAKLNATDNSNFNFYLESNPENNHVYKIHLRMKERQDKVASMKRLLDIWELDSIAGWVDLDANMHRLNDTRSAIAQSKYASYRDSIYSGNKGYTAQALEMLAMSQEFMPNSFDYHELTMDLIQKGSTEASVYFENFTNHPLFDLNLDDYFLFKNSKPYFSYYKEDSINTPDVSIEFLVTKLLPIRESISTHTESYTKEVQDGCITIVEETFEPQPDLVEIVHITYGDTILERERRTSQPPKRVLKEKVVPRMIVVSGCITYENLTVSTAAELTYTVTDLVGGKDYSGKITSRYIYEDCASSTSGDSRAIPLSFSCGIILSQPSDDQMWQGLRSNTIAEIAAKLRAIGKTDRSIK